MLRAGSFGATATTGSDKRADTSKQSPIYWILEISENFSHSCAFGDFIELIRANTDINHLLADFNKYQRNNVQVLTPYREKMVLSSHPNTLRNRKSSVKTL